ncbi:MAG: carbohydrate-binding protein, partial [Bacteroidales bacterium]|nr:carbohydrate-binding protein [Bacteroidales bacterium]
LKTAKIGIPNTGVVKDMPYSTGKRNMYVNDIDNGEYIRLRGVDFANGASSFSITAAATGSVEISLRLDSPTGAEIGKVLVKPTGSVEKYKAFTGKVSGASGVHDLYITFQNANGEVRLDWWNFKK